MAVHDALLVFVFVVFCFCGNARVADGQQDVGRFVMGERHFHCNNTEIS